MGVRTSCEPRLTSNLDSFYFDILFFLKPCSERVLVTLSTQCKDYVTPLLESTFKQAIGKTVIYLAPPLFNALFFPLQTSLRVIYPA
jgi:hypothetical protein